MNQANLFKRANSQFGQLVEKIKPEQWDQATPDSEWTVRQLVNHLAGESGWAVELLAGKTIAEVGTKLDGDLLGDDPQAKWKEIAAAVYQAVDAPESAGRIVHLSYGDVTGSSYMMELFFDNLVHSWDLGVSIGSDSQLDAELVEVCYGEMRGRVAELQQSGLFAAPIDVAPDASSLHKLLALTGRNPNWAATS